MDLDFTPRSTPSPRRRGDGGAAWQAALTRPSVATGRAIAGIATPAI